MPGVAEREHGALAEILHPVGCKLFQDLKMRADPHRRFVDLLHDMDAVVWEMDAQTWRFNYVSPRAEKMFGYPVQRWLDEPSFWQDELLHPDDRAWCVSYCSIASGECRNHAFIYRARHAHGHTIWIKDVVRVIPDEQGRPSVMRGVMVDVTNEHREAEHIHSEAVDYDAPELEELRAILAA